MPASDDKFSSEAVERFYLDRAELLRVERLYALEMHYMRYHFVRQIVSGVVVDAACGCGYGTYLLTQKTPGITQVIGVDISAEAIEHANIHFKTDRNAFVCASIADFTHATIVDWIVSIETIEHLAAPEELPKLCRRHSAPRVVLTYPTRRTTHYNPFHFHDLTLRDVEGLFAPEYAIYDEYQYHREFKYVMLKQVATADQDAPGRDLL